MLWLLILSAVTQASDTKADPKNEFTDVLVLKMLKADGSHADIKDCKVREVKEENVFLVSYPKTPKGKEARYSREEVLEVRRAKPATPRTVPMTDPMAEPKSETKAAPPDAAATAADPAKADPAVATADPVAPPAAGKAEAPGRTAKPAKADKASADWPAPDASGWFADPDTRAGIRYGALAVIVLGLVIAIAAGRSGR